MASTEGSREVEAARKRLASARAQKLSASKMIAAAKLMAETAKKTEEEARSLFERSRDEAEEAEAFLKETEKRWEVIDVVDSDGENEKAGRRNKKRKVAPAAAAIVQPLAAAGAGSAGDATGVGDIVVEGAGIPEVNGTYRRCRTDGSDALPSSYDTDYPVYSKGGSCKRKAVNFFLYRSKYCPLWNIKCQPENHKDWNYKFFYRNETPGNNLPPKAGWAPDSNGGFPAPQVRMQR